MSRTRTSPRNGRGFPEEPERRNALPLAGPGGAADPRAATARSPDDGQGSLPLQALCRIHRIHLAASPRCNAASDLQGGTTKGTGSTYRRRSAASPAGSPLRAETIEQAAVAAAGPVPRARNTEPFVSESGPLSGRNGWEPSGRCPTAVAVSGVLIDQHCWSRPCGANAGAPNNDRPLQMPSRVERTRGMLYPRIRVLHLFLAGRARAGPPLFRLLPRTGVGRVPGADCWPGRIAGTAAQKLWPSLRGVGGDGFAWPLLGPGVLWAV